MRNRSLYNNEIIGVYSLLIYLNESKKIELEKYFLLLPLLLNDNLMNYIKSQKSHVRGIEELVLKKYDLLINFNNKFYDLLPLSVNCLDILTDSSYITIKDNFIMLDKQIDFKIIHNKRLQNINDAIKKIVLTMSDSSDSLYFQLRVML